MSAVAFFVAFQPKICLLIPVFFQGWLASLDLEHLVLQIFFFFQDQGIYKNRGTGMVLPLPTTKLHVLFAPATLPRLVPPTKGVDYFVYSLPSIFATLKISVAPWINTLFPSEKGKTIVGTL